MEAGVAAVGEVAGVVEVVAFSSVQVAKVISHAQSENVQIEP